MQAMGDYQLSQSAIDGLLLFEYASRESIEAALAGSRIYRAAPGEIVLAPNVMNAIVYVVLKGTLRVEVVGRESSEHSHVGTGECVGELSVIDGGATSASVLAVDECELLALSRETVLELVDRSHAFARNLVRLLSRRLKGSNRLLRDEAETSDVLRHQVSFDALTGLHSRAWLDATLPRMCNRVRHGGDGFALAMCDVDFFKRINDNFGHLVGDRVLQKIAGVLVDCLRPTDFAARFGGEELVAILCGTDAVAAAVTAAERIRLAVRSIAIEGIPVGNTPEVTISIGVAVFQPEEASEQLVRRADAALYLAKRGGRDRVEAHTEENTFSQ
jgi:diguanylate cyclase (GGDEF)-like protein